MDSNVLVFVAASVLLVVILVLAACLFLCVLTLSRMARDSTDKLLGTLETRALEPILAARRRAQPPPFVAQHGGNGRVPDDPPAWSEEHADINSEPGGGNA